MRPGIAGIGSEWRAELLLGRMAQEPLIVDRQGSSEAGYSGAGSSTGSATGGDAVIGLGGAFVEQVHDANQMRSWCSARCWLGPVCDADGARHPNP